MRPKKKIEVLEMNGCDEEREQFVQFIECTPHDALASFTIQMSDCPAPNGACTQRMLQFSSHGIFLWPLFAALHTICIVRIRSKCVCAPGMNCKGDYNIMIATEN